MNPAQYFAHCEAHDWYYAYSDDGRVYREGAAIRAALLAEAAGDPVLAAIYAAWSAHVESPLDPDDNSRRVVPRPSLSELLGQTSFDIN